MASRLAAKRANCWWRWLAFFGLLFVPCIAGAAPPTNYELRTLDGVTHLAQITAWSQTQGLKLLVSPAPRKPKPGDFATRTAPSLPADAREMELDWQQVRWLERTDLPQTNDGPAALSPAAASQPAGPTQQSNWLVELRAGGRLRATRLQLREEKVQGVLASGGRFHLPLEQVIRLGPSTASSPHPNWPAAAVDQDRLRLRVEDREQVVDGLVSELVDGQLTFTFEGRETRLPQERVLALVLATGAGQGGNDSVQPAASGPELSGQKGNSPVRTPTAAPIRFAITLAGGQRFTAQSWRWISSEPKAAETAPANQPSKSVDPVNRRAAAAPDLHLELVGGGEVELAWHEIQRLDVLGGRVTYLSELKPSAYEHRPLITTKRSWRPDASVGGELQRIDGISFQRGLGMPSPARLTFELQGKYETLVAEIGIDDETKGRGDAVWVVWLDEREAFRQRCRAGEAARSLRLPLQGVQRLTLAIEAGENLDLADHADWADAHLLAPHSP
ncbi:MAG: NPCBM/NEW2 domain-containing protein [Planctomycetota bacterium]